MSQASPTACQPGHSVSWPRTNVSGMQSHGRWRNMGIVSRGIRCGSEQDLQSERQRRQRSVALMAVARPNVAAPEVVRKYGTQVGNGALQPRRRTRRATVLAVSHSVFRTSKHSGLRLR